MALTGDRGVDTAIEAVGVPDTFLLCQDIVAAGGTIANIGVHGVKVDLHLERLWSQNITLTTRLVDTAATPMLLKAVQAKKVDPSQLVTHHSASRKSRTPTTPSDTPQKTQALKVIIEA